MKQKPQLLKKEMKPKNIKIIAISATSGNSDSGDIGGRDDTVYGLGDDETVYYWDIHEGVWKLNKII